MQSMDQFNNKISALCTGATAVKKSVLNLWYSCIMPDAGNVRLFRSVFSFSWREKKLLVKNKITVALMDLSPTRIFNISNI